jgi:hypothetical protein
MKMDACLLPGEMTASRRVSMCEVAAGHRSFAGAQDDSEERRTEMRRWFPLAKLLPGEGSLTAGMRSGGVVLRTLCGLGWTQILRGAFAETFGQAQDRLRRMDQDDHGGRAGDDKRE